MPLYWNDRAMFSRLKQSRAWRSEQRSRAEGKPKGLLGRIPRPNAFDHRVSISCLALAS